MGKPEGSPRNAVAMSDDEYSADFEGDLDEDEYEDDFDEEDTRPSSRLQRMPRSPVPTNIVDESVARPVSAPRSPRSPPPAHVADETLVALPSPVSEVKPPWLASLAADDDATWREVPEAVRAPRVPRFFYFETISRTPRRRAAASAGGRGRAGASRTGRSG